MLQAIALLAGWIQDLEHAVRQEIEALLPEQLAWQPDTEIKPVLMGCFGHPGEIECLKARQQRQQQLP